MSEEGAPLLRSRAVAQPQEKDEAMMNDGGDLESKHTAALPATAGEFDLRLASILLQVLQLVLILLFALFVSSEIDNDGSFTTGYSMFSGILIMMLIGFGYLMTFISSYQLGSVAYCLLLTVIALQFSIFTDAFWRQMYSQQFSYIDISIYPLISALYAVGAVLISLGAVIGKTSPVQLLVLTLFELIFYSFNNEVLLLGVLGVKDAGGTIAIHLFGAYFGLASAYMLGLPKGEIRESYTADIFSLIGTAFLWAYWPSFVGGFLEPGSSQQQRAIVNTVLALVASTSTAFAASIMYSKDSRFRPADIQNATLSGGVAIGAIANLTLDPWTVLVVGFVAGHVSVFGFARLQAWLEKNCALHDSAGIHNLHGMPSVIGGLASVVVAAWKTTGGRTSDSEVYGDSAQYQSALQLAGVGCTLFVAMASGLLAGLVMRSVETEPVKTFQDSVWWCVDDKYSP